jgi:hypothetical protein
MSKNWFQNLTGLLTGCSLFLLQGCGGDPGSSAFMGEFEPTSHQPTSKHVDMIQDPASSVATRIGVDLQIVDMSVPVYAAAFDMVYDPDIVKLNEVLPGGFLESTSSEGVTYTTGTELENTPDGPVNVLVFSASQTGNDPGSSGSGTLATLVFELLKPGCTYLNFVVTDRNNVQRSQLLTPVAPNSPTLSPISGVTWSPGGTITVRIEGDTKICTPTKIPEP